jgi:glutamate racemase
MPRNSVPRLMVFDSGLGGLTVLRALRQSVPEAAITYLADDARFPYAGLSDAELSRRVCEVLAAPVAEFAPDALVIACNTASTTALPALRAAFPQPVIGTVPAIKPAALLSRSGLVSVLGTPATVKRDYTRALIAEFGAGAAFTLIGSARLAGLAETLMAGGEVADAAISAEIDACFTQLHGGRTDVIVLACTHYPLLMDRLERLAPWPVTWLDPAPAIARRTANVLADLGFAVGVGFARGTGRAVFTSGRAATPELAALLATYGLVLANAEQCG